MATVQLKTVSHRSHPSDYWPEWFYYEDDYTKGSSDREATACLVETGTVEGDLGHIYRMCDHGAIIVEEPNGYDHPDADTLVRVYDGYNE